MTIFLYLSAILFGLFFKKSKVCTIYITAVMIFLATYNYQNADIANYQISYSRAQHSDSFRYIGYTNLIRLCAKAGLSWIQFRLLFYLLVFTILIITIKIFTKNVNTFLFFYLITYYGIDVVQMKSHISYMMVFFAIAYMIKCLTQGKQLKDWRIVFSVSVLVLSFLLHFSAIFYLLAFFVFGMLYRRKNMTKKMIVMLLTAFIAFYGGVISIIARYANQLGILSDMNYLENWFQVHTRYGYLLPTSFVIVIVLSCNLNDFNIHSFEYYDNKTKSDILLSRFVSTSLMLIPLFILNTSYDRLIRVYVMFALLIYVNKQKRLHMSYMEFINAIFTCIMLGFSFYFGVYSFYDTTLGAILKYNSFV